MNKKFLISVLVFFFVLFFPSPTKALVMYTYDSFSNLELNKPIPIKIFFDTEGKEINVMTGKLKINGPVRVSVVNTQSSIFSMWPEGPAFNGNEEINFTGGVEGGVYGKDLKLFSFTLTPIAKGEISIKPINVTAYLNDGRGTELKNRNSDITINPVKTNKLIYKVLVFILVISILFTIINIFRKIFFKKRNE